MFGKRVYGNEAKIGVVPNASGKRSEQSEKERKTTETNQWHMIVCIYCRTDSCRSHVRATLLYVTLGVFMYFNCGMSVRKSVLLLSLSSSLLRLCIRLCRCWSLDIIWRHIILCYSVLVLVCPFFPILCMYLCARSGLACRLSLSSRSI